MSELQQLSNIGKELDKQLNAVGIHSFDDLANIGSQEAWLKIKAMDPSACINRLMSLEGALQGMRWHNLPEKEKQRLQDFYNRHKE